MFIEPRAVEKWVAHKLTWEPIEPYYFGGPFESLLSGWVRFRPMLWNRLYKKMCLKTCDNDFVIGD